MQSNKDTKPVLTIAIPTFNRMDYLSECLSSVLTQVNPSIVEVLISDNHSTDDTYSYLKKIQIQYPFLKIYRNPTNVGMDGNFLQCYKKASGKYLWLLGDDDYLLPNTLENICECLEFHKPQLLHITQNPGRNSFQLTKSTDEALRDISFWITYCSANIFRIDESDGLRTKFDRYQGSLLCVTHMYIDALLPQDPKIVQIGDKLISGGHNLSRNGGYNFFTVFGENLLRILKKTQDRGIISKQTYIHVKRDLFKYHIWPNYVRYVINRKDSNYLVNKASIIVFKNFFLDLHILFTIIKRLSRGIL